MSTPADLLFARCRLACRLPGALVRGLLLALLCLPAVTAATPEDTLA